MSTAIAVIAAGTIMLFIGILIGKGSQERKERRADKKRIADLERKIPRAVRMENYQRSS